MRELQEEFIGKGQVKGFTFTQIKKSEHGYIYEVNTKDNIHYEVFYHKENKLYECVSYPSNKAFGVWAWTCRALDIAEDILNNITLRKGVNNG